MGKRTGLLPLIAAAVLTAPWGGNRAVPAAAQPAGPGMRGRFDELLASYRKIIALLADDDMDEATRARVVMAASLLSQHKAEVQAELSADLAADLEHALKTGGRVRLVERFLSRLEEGKTLHDADKLAFAEVLEDLAEVARSAPEAAGRDSWLSRIEEDVRALAEIRERYDRELEKIFGRLRTRGMGIQREAWNAYLGFVRGIYARDAILEVYREDLSAALGESRSGRPPAPEKAINGLRLPPKTLILTFDDGPHPRYTDRIREILDKHGVKGIFFELGRNVGVIGNRGIRETRAAQASRRLRDGGHLVGNHTYSHQLLPKLSETKAKEEIEEADETIEEALSTTSKPELFRPPYGATNPRVRSLLTSRGQKPFLWNIDSLDWSDPVPRSIVERTVAEAEKQGRGIILMHDIHPQSVAALPQIIERLQKKGYRFASFSEPEIAAALGGPEPAEPPLYRESYAVIVGINAYAKWPQLSYAVNDAQAVRDLLIRKYGFKPENITTLRDGEATRERILSVLGDTLSAPDKVKHDDRVFFFFAGHGTTRKLPSGKSLGYIVPVEADTVNYQSQAISMTNFQDMSESIPAKHVLFVMDACYSGLALSRGGPGAGLGKFVLEMARRNARQMLTAGGADEQVADNGPAGHSIFTWTLLQALDGRADLNGDQVITASELAAYVGPAVSSFSHQTPAFGNLPGSEGGEFVFSMAHDGELLSDLSAQLDEEAIALNAELEKVRREIAEKEAKNGEAARQLATARKQLASLERQPALAAGEQARRRGDEGMRLYKEKRYPEALAEFEAAVQLDPADVQSVNNAGFVYYKLGDYAASLRWLRRALALDPKRAAAYLNLGDTCEKLGLAAEASAAWRRYLELMPGSPLRSQVRDKLARVQ